jgi:glutamate formiminotransferase
VYEIVPNVSEGRDDATIDAMIAAAEAMRARVIHRTSDAAHHRSVLTIVGDASTVVAAAVAIAGVAYARIDLRAHRGEHPRIGALDVLPFVPLEHATLADAAALARRAAAAIWSAYAIPSIFYGAAATAPHRALLADVRRGEFAGLDERAAPEHPFAFDVGDRAHASAGAIAVGARPILVAYNVDLATDDVRIARRIARLLRERDGGLRTIRALGLRIAAGRVQVSVNITDSDAVPPYRVTELVRALAEPFGVRVLRTEVIGLLPRAALARTAAYYLGQPPTSGNQSVGRRAY